MIESKLKNLTFFSLAVLFGTGQAFAHTGVRDKVDEGASSYNGFTITHGCGGHDGQAYPVLGQTALYPFGGNAVYREANGSIIDGSTVIEIGEGLPGISLGVTGYAGFSSPFVISQEIVDDNNVVHALHWKGGAMEPKLNAITPFKISAPKIIDHCVDKLGIRVGVINWCDIGKNEANDTAGPYNEPHDAFGNKIPMVSDININEGDQVNVAGAAYFKRMRQGNGDNNRADYWFGNLEGDSALYHDQDLIQQGTQEVERDANGNPILDANGDQIPKVDADGKPVYVPHTAYWTTITVNNKDANPAGCPGGKLRTVTVEPPAEDFDTYLTGANTNPFTKGVADF